MKSIKAIEKIGPLYTSLWELLATLVERGNFVFHLKIGAMNQQMTDLEDQAANYLRQIMDLESEVKKSTSLLRSVKIQDHL